MNPANYREALIEINQDENEGADILMVRAGSSQQGASLSPMPVPLLGELAHSDTVPQCAVKEPRGDSCCVVSQRNCHSRVAAASDLKVAL